MNAEVKYEHNRDFKIYDGDVDENIASKNNLTLS